MAKTVAVFRDHMAKEAHLSRQQEDERRQSAEDKRAALVKMAETIESETREAIHQVSQRTGNMVATADAMRASAGRTGTSATNAADAAKQALATAQTVASAAEQLTASIHEIGSQVNQSSVVVAEAVEAGEATRAAMEALNEKVGRIGAVADVISEIAARTNLLALNATIEAARAGDAGKGFAVVAGEVKQLATQTAQSTAEISHQIAEVRAAMEASVAAVNRIEQTIGAINSISGSIAAAVEQQGVATAEITRSVAETANSANAMTSQIGEVSTEAAETDRHAITVRDDAMELDHAVAGLRQSVIRVVRTSTHEVDRRSTIRYRIDRACRIRLADRTLDGLLVDLSEGGACIRAVSQLADGQHAALEMEGVAQALSFVVVHAEDEVLHVAFDEDASSMVRAYVEQLGVLQAA